MTVPHRFTVDPADAGQRLDRLLAARGPWGSRAQVQRLISDGAVRIDGRPVKPGTILRAGQVVEVTGRVPEPLPPGLEPEPIPLDILFEDEWLLVIDKPAGLVVHPAPGNWRGTLVAALLHHWHGARPGLDPTRPGIVHRLDKDTSGVLVVAKDPDTLAHLGTQFRRREVAKQYVAAVWGRMPRDRGTIDAPIARNPVHRKRMAIRPGGREASTAYEVIDRFARITFVRLFPKTGRTHQIRVHLAAIGHPIVADAVYGTGRSGTEPLPIHRQALHAERIAFRHPQTGAPVAFEAPWPRDLRDLRHHCASSA